MPRTGKHFHDVCMVVAVFIALAGANKRAIAHPPEHGPVTLSLLLAGGPILFVAAQGSCLWAAPKDRSWLHLIGGTAMPLVAAEAGQPQDPVG